MQSEASPDEEGEDASTLGPESAAPAEETGGVNLYIVAGHEAMQL